MMTSSFDTIPFLCYEYMLYYYIVPLVWQIMLSSWSGVDKLNI